jgi:predicted small secreted protein
MPSQLAAVLAVLAMLGSTMLLTACNTVAGAGQDVSATGHAVSNGAEKLKP